MLDPDAYLERIGLDGRPSIAQVHRAHLTSIPFENLDPHQGLPVSLDVEDLERKLVTERRGGYCFERNLLLKAALQALGAEVDMFLARMCLPGLTVTSFEPAKPGVVRPRSHLLLRVSENGASWHADVGFARGILEPIPFGPGPTQEQSGWSFRVVEDGSELVLQKLAGDEWADVYGFLPQPVPLIDVETPQDPSCRLRPARMRVCVRLRVCTLVAREPPARSSVSRFWRCSGRRSRLPAPSTPLARSTPINECLRARQACAVSRG